jgi:hypothetical protein
MKKEYRLRLIHWNAAEAEQRAVRLQAAGYAVDSEPFTGPPSMRKLRAEPPDAVVIDLSRLPSQGRDVAVNIRHHKATRLLPIVFVGGQPEKVDRIRELLPEAIYTNWDEIAAALPQAITHPPDEVTVPSSTFAGYSGTPLPKKLGIKAGTTVALVNAPDDFERVLGELPEGVRLVREASSQAEVILWFNTWRAELEEGLPGMVPLAKHGGLWLIWPKKTAGMATDLKEPVVRELGLAAGLVDFKIAAIDETWSGLRFTSRRSSQK